MHARVYVIYLSSLALALMLAGRSAPEAARQTPAVKAPAPQTTAPRPASTAPARPQTNTSSPGEKLPPIQYVCIMPGDEGVLEDKPGKCPNPKCGMDLRPVRLTTAYSSITHPTQIQPEPGKDRLDGRPLVPITASMFWVCAGSDDHLLDPGKCADGSVRRVSYERRPHGDHNPRHGGQFFMADDAWHHLEGTYPRGGPFRLFFYDDFTRPMAVKGFAGDIVLVDDNDKEVGAPMPLKPGRATNTLETPIKGGTLPLKLKLKVQFEPKDKVRTFDFTFKEPTIEPVAPVAVTTSAPAKPAAAPTAAASAPPPATAPRAPSVAPGTCVSSLTMSRAEAAQLSQELPNDAGALIKLLDCRGQEVKSLIQDGNFGMVYVPSLLARDVALALVDHVNELPDQKRIPATSAVRRLVLSAWRLDQYGDLGDRTRINQAHESFAAASADIKAAYAR
jgi:hypothetical protein